MRIRSLTVQRFGALQDRHFDLDPKAVVVFGPNEAGKSSFHAAIETALYGFSPANREQHPYAAWDEEIPLELVAEVTPTTGEPFAVERTLRTSPGVRVAATPEELTGTRKGNGALPGLDALSRTLFRAVYSLSANDSNFQRDEVREHIRELLLGEKGISGARPLREVRARLRDEMGSLWRPNERGRPRAKVLRGRLRDAEREMREARKRERFLQDEALEQADLLEERDELVARRETLRREEQESAFLEEIAELRGRMDAVRPLKSEGLTGGMEDPTPIHEELALLRAELEAPRNRLAAPEERLPLFDRMLLGRHDEVEAILGEVELDRSERERLVEFERRAEGAERGARERLDRTGTDEAEVARFEAAPLAELEEGLRLWQAELVENSADPAGAARTRVLLAAAILCLVLAVTGLAPVWTALGVLLAVPAYLARTRGPAPIPAPRAVTEPLASLGIEAPESPLTLRRTLSDLDDARSLFGEARRERAEAERLRRHLGERESRWRRVAADLFDGEVTELPERLREAVAKARRKQSDLEEASKDRERDQNHVAAHRTRERRLEKRCKALEETLSANFPGLDTEAAYSAWRDTEAELEYVRKRERELREDERWGELALDDRLEAEGDARPWSEAARRERADELTELDTRLEALRERRGEIGAHLDDASTGTVAEAAEAVTELQAELAKVHEKRDRLALLERILITAERAYREAHQPDILARAGEYLTLVTSGRYTGLCYPEGDDGPLHVQPADLEEPVPVDLPLSRGTREQIYLCLRLGTLDDLDRDRERLPLVLDEALVHWDPVRREALYPLLDLVSERRQVVLFTCQPELAAEAAEGLGARRVDLLQGAPHGS